jgi:hypothetical protein
MDCCIFAPRIQRAFVKPEVVHPPSFKSLKMEENWGRYGTKTREPSEETF